MPLTASHTPLLTLHMLWVDLSKCFMEFSREVGQLLQARRGVPAQEGSVEPLQQATRKL